MNDQSPGRLGAVALAAGVAAGERVAVASALNLIDDSRPASRARASALIARLPEDRLFEGGHLIGLTGPPGVGKSSLAAALIRVWRGRGLRVGVLAVDPSSLVSGGALLGDRLRLAVGAGDTGVFIRSLANRGTFGGLAPEVWPMSLVMLAAFDVVLIETVGVGQREIDVAGLADTTCFVAQPYSGDTIQFLKAGIMEVPHVLAVNKTDIGIAWEATFADLSAVIAGRTTADDWRMRLVATSATAGTGIDELAAALLAHRGWLEEIRTKSRRRHACQGDWVIARIREEFGRHGVAALGGDAVIREHIDAEKGTIFDHVDRLTACLANGAFTDAPVFQKGGLT